MTSPYPSRPVRNEAEVRSRRRVLEDDLRAEGASDDAVAKLATDDTAEKMLAHERMAVSSILSLFRPK